MTSLVLQLRAQGLGFRGFRAESCGAQLSGAWGFGVSQVKVWAFER